MSNTNDNNKNSNNSLFLYTSLIFIAAIIVIIFAYFSQANIERAQPEPSNTATEQYDPNALTASPETGGPQGIAKTAAELSQYNLELLEENRELHNRVDELEEKLKIYEPYEPFIEMYSSLSDSDKENLKLLLENMDLGSLLN